MHEAVLELSTTSSDSFVDLLFDIEVDKTLPHMSKDIRPDSLSSTSSTVSSLRGQSEEPIPALDHDRKPNLSLTPTTDPGRAGLSISSLAGRDVQHHPDSFALPVAPQHRRASLPAIHAQYSNPFPPSPHAWNAPSPHTLPGLATSSSIDYNSFHLDDPPHSAASSTFSPPFTYTRSDSPDPSYGGGYTSSGRPSTSENSKFPAYNPRGVTTVIHGPQHHHHQHHILHSAPPSMLSHHHSDPLARSWESELRSQHAAPDSLYGGPPGGHNNSNNSWLPPQLVSSSSAGGPPSRGGFTKRPSSKEPLDKPGLRVPPLPVPPPIKRRGKLPKSTTDLLKSWLSDHVDHPYPSEDEKKNLCAATGLTMNQVSNWMINARRRILAPARNAAHQGVQYAVAKSPPINQSSSYPPGPSSSSMGHSGGRPMGSRSLSGGLTVNTNIVNPLPSVGSYSYQPHVSPMHPNSPHFQPSSHHHQQQHSHFQNSAFPQLPSLPMLTTYQHPGSDNPFGLTGGGSSINYHGSLGGNMLSRSMIDSREYANTQLSFGRRQREFESEGSGGGLPPPGSIMGDTLHMPLPHRHSPDHPFAHSVTGSSDHFIKTPLSRSPSVVQPLGSRSPVS